MATTGEVLRIVGNRVPEALAEDWDNSGLQVGDLTREVRRILVSLDADIFAVEAARAIGANLLITHHPLILNPVKSIELNNPLGRVINAAVRDEITIYSAHTNLDALEGGVNDILAAKIGLSNVIPLFGSVGRIGNISGETLGSFSERIKVAFAVPHIGVLGESVRKIKRVAVCGGSGGSFLRTAVQEGADLLVTGDVKYHTAKDAEAFGIAVIDIGHFASEEIVLPVLAVMIRDELKKNGMELNVDVHSGRDPIRLL